MMLVMLVLFVSAVIAVVFHVDRAHSPGTKGPLPLCQAKLLATCVFQVSGHVSPVCHPLSGCPSRSLALQFLD